MNKQNQFCLQSYSICHIISCFPIIFTQQAAEKPNGELTCTMAYIQNKGYLEVTGTYVDTALYINVHT